ncbi:hypothetical protein [Palaeococcus sp. (in: euryarchaeotes)]
MRSDRIFALFLGVYLLLALLGKIMFPGYLGTLNPVALFYALLFSLLIFLGYLFSDKLPKERLYLYLVVSTLMGASTGILGIVLSLSILLGGIFLMRNGGTDIRHVYYAGFVLVILLPLIAIVKGVIPILEPHMRYTPMKNLYFASAIFATLLLSYKPNIYLFLIAEAFAVISTFRTNALIVFLAYIFRAGREEAKRVLLLGVPLILLVFIVRFYATKGTYAIWKLGFIQTLVYRAGFSYMVYERLFSLGMPLGRFNILLNKYPRFFVASLFGKSTSYTYTLFGQPAYDFGIFGLMEGFLVGVALRDAERVQTFKSLALVFLVLAIENGFDALNFGIIMGSAFFSLGSREGFLWKEIR